MKRLKDSLLIIDILLLVLLLVLFTISKFARIILLIGNINEDMVFYTGQLLVAFVTMILIVCRYLTSKKHLKQKFILTLFICLGLAYSLFCSFSYSFSFSDPKYFKFVSPDDKHTIIVEEWSWLLGGGGNVYERVNRLFVISKGSVGTDDGFRAFSANQYWIEWEKDTVTITVDMGNGYGAKDSVKINLSQ